MAAEAPARRTFLYALPVLVFLGLAGFLYAGLYLRPQEIPSPLIGKPAPQFALPPIEGLPGGLARADIEGKVSLVSVFASWCGPCRIEHPLLMALAERKRLPIYGIAYKDKPEDAKAWLADLGNPYDKIGADRDGRVGLDWGVYGVPETYLIDKQGNIAFKVIGPLSPEVLESQLLPLVEKLEK
jgi:cytochrome c biogenesis protein CcmG/thiol:disulfide interchange protein DsbE